MTDFARARTNMVDSQLRPNGITNARILDAMHHVQREDFLPEAQKAVAYMDGDVPLRNASEAGRCLIEPMAFARMVQLADVKAGDRVLDIGAATGYGAAILAQLAQEVVAVEEDNNLARFAAEKLNGIANIKLEHGRLCEGSKIGGRFDAIIIEGRIEELPVAMIALLKAGGRIVAAHGPADVCKCCIWTVSGSNHTHRRVFDISVAALPGFEKVNSGFAF